MEASEAKTELVSPPQAHISWGENSPLLGDDPPFAEVFFRKAPHQETSSGNPKDSTQMADGFLSEVSTPDRGTNNKKLELSLGKRKEEDQSPFCISAQNNFSKDKEEERHIFDVTPPKAINKTNGDVTDSKEFKGEENVFLSSHSKTEEVLQCQSISTSVLQIENIRKEESQVGDEISSETRNLPFTSDAPSRTEVGQDFAITMKRKCFHRSERQLQRKRFKGNLPQRSRSKGTAQWSHLSEEELKKLRRVKNRESVERCRTKQRLRMEALQVEQTCLRLENKNLREARNSIRAVLRDISEQMKSLKRHMENRDKGDDGKVEKELQRGIQA